MQKFLTNIMNNSKTNNEINKKDWKNFPLPTLPRERLIFNNSSMNIEIPFNEITHPNKNFSNSENFQYSTLNNSLQISSKKRDCGNENKKLTTQMNLSKSLQYIQSLNNNNNNNNNNPNVIQIKKV